MVTEIGSIDTAAQGYGPKDVTDNTVSSENDKKRDAGRMVRQSEGERSS